MSQETRKRSQVGQGRSGMRRNFFQKIWDFSRRISVPGEGEQEPPLNDIHDRADDRGWGRPWRDDPGARLLGLEERVESIDRRMKKLEERLGSLESLSEESRAKDRSPKVSAAAPEKPKRVSPPAVPNSGRTTWREDEDLVIEPPELTSPFQLAEDEPGPARRAATPARLRANQWTAESFERALGLALGERSSTGLEVDTLLADLQAQLGDVQVEPIPVGGQQQVTVFWLSDSREGFAVVSPGGLADSEVVKFFNVDFGRRIFGCRQPARVARDGNEFVVVRKGTVESS
jgi:hypothetical protein